MAEETSPRSKKSSTKEPSAVNEETAPFDPLASLTEDQLLAKDQLQALALEYTQDDREKAWLTDMCLLRYLRARDWKVEKAEKMLKATIDWRREWHVEDIRREDVILTLELKSLYRNGSDKLGRPVMFIKPSYNPNTVEYRLKSLIYSLEECIESMDASKGVEKICLIADFETESKLQKKSADQTTVAKNFINFLQNHYPERLGVCFALNPPWYMRLLYSLVSPFMDPVTKKKIHFVNGNKDHVKAELLKFLDDDQLETCYGGSRTMDGEEDCRNLRLERLDSPTSAASTDGDNGEAAANGEKKKKKKKKKKVTEGEDATNEEHPKIEDASALDAVAPESVAEATVDALEKSMEEASGSDLEEIEVAEKKKKKKSKA